MNSLRSRGAGNSVRHSALILDSSTAVVGNYLFCFIQYDPFYANCHGSTWGGEALSGNHRASIK